MCMADKNDELHAFSNVQSDLRKPSCRKYSATVHSILSLPLCLCLLLVHDINEETLESTARDYPLSD